MSKYPRMNELGINNPEQIVKYSVNSINLVDYLRVVYERPKGSLLPPDRVFRFPRIQKTADVDNDGTAETVMQSSPELREVLDEIKQLVQAKECTADIAEVMLDELRRLEECVASQVSDIKDLIAELPKV